MDRNQQGRNGQNIKRRVALRKESVDRTIAVMTEAQSEAVALRKESVDRNLLLALILPKTGLSLSARRAWIEIDWASVISAMTSVALRKESVDRNRSGRIRL